jgi:predicted MPP superfamily phosphohydrolase
MTMRVVTVFFFVGLIAWLLLAGFFQTGRAEATPRYAGFADIDPRKNSFIVVGDTQGTMLFELWREHNDKERKIILKEIARREPAFVIHLGDLTNDGDSIKKWQEFDVLNKSLREKKIPYFPILGNHEFWGDDKKALQYYFDRFPHLEHRRWYSFRWKNVGLIMLDANFSTLSEKEIEQQAAWYKRELEAFEKDKKIDYVIVCCHEPPYTNSRVVTPSKKVQTLFADPFVSFRKTRFFFSGHSHAYERFQQDGKWFIVSGGGGGPRHKVYVDPRKRRYEDLYPGPALRFLHFCELEVDASGLNYKVLRLESTGAFTVADLLTIARARQPAECPWYSLAIRPCAAAVLEAWKFRGMFFKPRGQLRLGEFSHSEVQHHHICLFFLGNYFPTVTSEEDVHQNQGDPLVSIDKGVILTKMVSIGSSFFKDSFVDEPACDRHFRLSKCRFEQFSISNAGSAAVALQ